MAFAQESDAVEMADALRSSGKIYVVVSILAIIFLGLTIFLFSLDYRVRKLQKEVDNNK